MTLDELTGVTTRCAAGKVAGVQAENLSATHAGGSYLLIWAAVPDADCFVVTRTGSEPVTLPAGSRSYVSPDTTELSTFVDLRSVRVSPVVLSVLAYRSGVVIRYFSHLVPCPSLVYVAARGSGQTACLPNPSRRASATAGRTFWTR